MECHILVLADEHAVAAVLIRERAQLLQQLVEAWLHDLELHEAPVLVRRQGGGVHDLACRGRQGVVGQIRVLEDRGDGIEPETIHPQVEPEAHHIPHCGLDLGVAPVEVRLFLEERVIVVLVRPAIELPGRAAEDRGPVVGRPVHPIAPDIPIPFRVGAGGTRLEEPAMLIGGVVEDQVQDDADVAGVCLVEEGGEVCQRAVLGRDVRVVGNVVAAVQERGWIMRRQPDRIDAETGQVIEPGSHSREVTDAVPVAVREAARIDLIEDGPLPPCLLHSGSSDQGQYIRAR